MWRTHIIGWGMVVVALTAAPVGAAGSGGRPSLIDAVKSGDAAAVRAVVTRGGTDVNQDSGDGSTALHWAAHQGDVAIADLLLKAHANVNAVTDVGITPLWLASTNGQLEIVRRLLDMGADPNVSPRTGGTPLMRAASGGYAEVARALIAHGANANAVEASQQQTALMWATSRRQPAVVQVLLEAGANPNAQARIWREEVQLCCWAQTSDLSDLAEVNRGGFTALHFAARQGDVDSARLLLDAGARIDATAADGSAPLALAAFSDQATVVKLLLERGADPNAIGGGYAALHAAVLRGNAEVVRALLAKGANPNLRLVRPTPHSRGQEEYQFHKLWVGATPFWLATAFFEEELARTLLAAGADPTLTAKDGTTPLVGLASAFLRQTGQYEGRAVLPSAEQQRRALSVAKFLVDELGANVNAANDKGNTAIHKAAERRMPGVVQFLGEHGGRVNAKNARGQTPMMVVNSCPRCEIGAFILQLELDSAAVGREQMVAVLQKLGAEE